MSEPSDAFTKLAELVDALDRRFPDHNDPFARVARLCEETGELASAVNHAEGMGVKNDKHGPPDPDHLVKEVGDVLRAALGIAQHYGLVDQVRVSIVHHHGRYRNMGYLAGQPDHERATPSPQVAGGEGRDS